MKTKKINSIGTVLKCNRTIVEKGKTDNPNTQMYDRSHMAWYRHFNK